MMPRYWVAALGLTISASAGLAGAEETTRVFRQGGSTAVITQEGGGSVTVRRTVTSLNSQSIVVQQDGGGASTLLRGKRCGAPASRVPKEECGPDPQILSQPVSRPRSLFEWAIPRAEKKALAAREAEDEKPPTRTERRISGEFRMDLQVSDSFRSRFLEQMSVR